MCLGHSLRKSSTTCCLTIFNQSRHSLCQLLPRSLTSTSLVPLYHVLILGLQILVPFSHPHSTFIGFPHSNSLQPSHSKYLQKNSIPDLNPPGSVHHFRCDVCLTVTTDSHHINPYYRPRRSTRSARSRLPCPSPTPLSVGKRSA